MNTAWQMWLDWYQCEESIRQKQVLDLAEENGLDPFRWPISRRLSTGIFAGGFDAGRGAEVNGISARDLRDLRADFFRQVIDIAKASIESCPWRNISRTIPARYSQG